ncbi:MAG: hypothetical protein HY862_14725 [Chloroflexi bacterium]|nr:hypothetical protein [Chloroflexota bacterium]
MRLVKKYAPKFGSYGLPQERATKYIDDLAQNRFAVKGLEIWYRQDKKPFQRVIKSLNKKQPSINHATAKNLIFVFYEVPKKILLKHDPVLESIAHVKNIILQFPENIEYISIYPHVPDQWLEKED